MHSCKDCVCFLFQKVSASNPHPPCLCWGEHLVLGISWGKGCGGLRLAGT